MKKLLRRILWYGFGVGLGVLLVAFIFRDRDFECSYFPNDRVLAELHRKPVRGADSALWKAVGADSTVLKAFLTLGEVDFGASQTRTRHEAAVPATGSTSSFRTARGAVSGRCARIARGSSR